MKANKYKYEVILQQNNGFGWDDVESFETNSSYLLKDSMSKMRRLINKLKQQSNDKTGIFTM